MYNLNQRFIAAQVVVTDYLDATESSDQNTCRTQPVTKSKQSNIETCTSQIPKEISQQTTHEDNKEDSDIHMPNVLHVADLDDVLPTSVNKGVSMDGDPANISSMHTMLSMVLPAMRAPLSAVPPLAALLGEKEVERLKASLTGGCCSATMFRSTTTSDKEPRAGQQDADLMKDPRDLIKDPNACPREDLLSKSVLTMLSEEDSETSTMKGPSTPIMCEPCVPHGLPLPAFGSLFSETTSLNNGAFLFLLERDSEPSKLLCSLTEREATANASNQSLFQSLITGMRFVT